MRYTPSSRSCTASNVTGEYFAETLPRKYVKQL
jgi:hypothetical protein